MVETSRQFSLRHIRHESKLNNSLYSMLLDQNLVDVILSCDGTNIRAHRLILSANSSYFKSLFDSLESNRCQIPIIILKDVPLSDLKAIVEFMYRGEVCVEERQLSTVLKSAELLKVFGLTEVCLALRSRLNNESVDNNNSTTTSTPTAQKRPRINEGVTQSPQSSDLFSNLSNARFEIRPTAQSTVSSPNIHSNQQQLPSIVSTANTLKTTTVVKNVILPSTQIHKKTDPMVQNVPKVTTTAICSAATTQPNTASNSVQNSPTLTTFTFDGQKSSPTAKQTPNVQTFSLSSALNSTWTPTQMISTQIPIHMPSGSRIHIKPPIEVLIDDETHELNKCSEDMDEDIKPPIFELNRRLNLTKEVAISDTESDSSKRDSETDINRNKRKVIKESKTETTKPVSRLATKSRTPSTSSQSSLPPPPTYRVVQRSSSRLLRNIIKPTACMASSATTSTAKTKDIEEKTKSNSKKEKQTVRLIKQNIPKSETDLMCPYGETGPEIECPSCGEKFNDEIKWNEHIASVHLIT